MDSQHGAQENNLIGQTIGNYLVTQKLGEGGMGSVYLAEHPSIGKKVALKVLHAEFSNNDEVAQRFFHEAKAVNNIGHPNIVDIVDYGVIDRGRDQLVYFIMEYLNGQTLSSVLRNEQQPMPPERALGIALQVADALSASHKCNIVHRDLKPDNIILQQRGRERDFVKLLDFGIAKLTGDNNTSRTRAGIVMGTPAYMSPEQCEGKANVDLRTDVYALGIVLYEMLVGRVPFIGDGYGEILVQHLTQNPIPPSSYRMLPPHVEAVVMKALQKRMELRYPSMDEFMRAMSDPVGYVESHGGIVHFAQQPIMPSSAPFTPSKVSFTPPPGSLQMPSGIYPPGTPNTPTTLGAAAGQAAPASGGKSKLGFIIAGVLIVAAAGVGIAVVAGGKKEATPVATPGSDTDPGSGTERTVQLDAAVEPAVVDAAPPPVADAAITIDAPPAAPTTSVLTFTTKPAGAAIFIDGKDTGKKTPEPVEVPRGSTQVLVELRLPSFDTVRQKVSVDQDATAEFTLKKRGGGTTTTPRQNPGNGKGSNSGSNGKTGGNDTGLERPD